MSANNLQQKISDGSAEIATIGLGYVGEDTEALIGESERSES
jgi:UDP-N-acetyl-D-mannosaminuronate dehydrogenase